MNSSVRNQGFTLVEVALAMALFLFGITALMGLFQFGGGLEASARAHAELAPALETVSRQLREEAWMLSPTGAISGLREIKGEPVPGAPGYHYDLVVETSQVAVPRALVRFYRKDPARVEASMAFLLPPEISLQRRLNPTSP